MDKMNLSNVSTEKLCAILEAADDFRSMLGNISDIDDFSESLDNFIDSLWDELSLRVFNQQA